MSEASPEQVKEYFERRLDLEIERLEKRLVSAEGFDPEARGPNWPPSPLLERFQTHLKGYMRAHAEQLAEDWAAGGEEVEYQECAPVLFELVNTLVEEKEREIRAILRGETTERASGV
jgi:hypothetical protein